LGSLVNSLIKYIQKNYYDKKARVSTSNVPIIEEELRYVPSSSQAEMILKVHEIAPLICPKCYSRMKIIAYLTSAKSGQFMIFL